MGGDLNLFHAEWKGDAEKTSGFDARVKKFTVAYWLYSGCKRPHKRGPAVGYLPSQAG